MHDFHRPFSGKVPNHMGTLERSSKKREQLALSRYSTSCVGPIFELKWDWYREKVGKG